jgi:succinate-acetate transporter protein
MTTIQTLHGVLIALAAVVGIAVAMSAAYFAAGGLHKLQQSRTARAIATPAQPATQPGETRELVLR